VIIPFRRRSEASTPSFQPPPYAVVDVETTGFSPWLHDRVIEIAVVRMSLEEGVLDEYCTLVNPNRDVGRTDIHGIRASDLRDAPTWSDIAGDVGTRIQDAILGAHNLRFDMGFLVSEFTRVGVPPPPLPGLCTLRLARQLAPGDGSYKLHHCCAQAGVEHEDEHTALGDARATAHLLACYLGVARNRGIADLRDLGCDTDLRNGWCTATPSGRSLTRDISARARDERSYLARLVEELPPTAFEDPDEGAYLDLLDRVVEDRRVTLEESSALLKTALEWGLTRAKVFEAHHKYLSSLVRSALRDGVVTSAERSDLELVCDLLGLHRAALDALLAAGNDPAATTLARTVERLTRAASAPPPATIAELRGRSVCFTGTFMARLRGQIVTRDEVERLALEAGMDVRKSVTKKLDLLVASDTESMSSKAKRARELGVQVIEEGAFWKALGAPVDIEAP
jgi:DNA polymerase III epsilon subunit-like protein